ncbi:MAG: hypothetical protein K1X81_02510 [Bacteroidia bacterium]|nr:hypothetical protein [Bacteroidia bacterium]
MLRYVTILGLLLLGREVNAQIKYLSYRSYFYQIIPAFESGQLPIALVEVKDGNALEVSMEERVDTVKLTSGTASIKNLISYNNTVSNWFNKNISEQGDYFYTSLREKVTHPSIHHYRLYTSDNSGFNLKVYYFSIDLSAELAALVPHNESDEVIRAFANGRNLDPGEVVQKHLLKLKGDSAAIECPKNAVYGFIETYYYSPALFPADEDPMMFPSQPIFSEEWEKFKAAYKTNFSFIKTKLNDASRNSYLRYSVHFIYMK